MNQQLHVSILFLCLPEKSANQLLSGMQPVSMHKLTSHLNLIEHLSVYELEAALIDIIELLLREEQTRITKVEHVTKVLRYVLPELDIPLLMKDITMDRKQSTELMQPLENRYRKEKRVRHFQKIIRGIRIRLLDNADTGSLNNDHFYNELLENITEKISSQTSSVIKILEGVMLNTVNAGSFKPAALGGRKKAALALLQLGEEAIERVLKYLASVERRALAFEMMCLEHINNVDQMLALTDYIDLLLNLKLITNDRSEYVRELLVTLRGDLLLTDESTIESHDNSLDEVSGELLELFGEHLYDATEQGQLFSLPEGAQSEPELVNTEKISDELIQIGIGAARTHPRLVARAIRYMFKQQVEI